METRVYEPMPGDIWTIYPEGLLNISVDEMETIAQLYDINIIQFWADGSISFQKGEEAENAKY